MAIFSLYVVIWSCTYTVSVYCLSISVYIYSVILYSLSNDGLASFEPSSHPWLFQYPMDYSCIWISWKYKKSINQSKQSTYDEPVKQCLKCLFVLTLLLPEDG